MNHRLSALFSTPRERDRMWAFLTGVAWEDWAQSEPMLGADEQPSRGEDSGMAKGFGSRTIGFSGEDIPQRAWVVCAWMAMQSTHRVRDWAVLRYDDEEVPVVVRGPQEPMTDMDALVVDEAGVLRAWRGWDVPKGPDDTAQRQLMNELGQAWRVFEISHPLTGKAASKAKTKSV